jgi:glutamate formiminotransferase/formiminotetrahydrofolate cyclodeaminase
MTQKLLECIPNFSEGRNRKVVEKILQAITAVSGVTLLDEHSDEDHNRTVVTFAGRPEAVVEAAYQGMATASKLIDMDKHEGEHPRIGATDVVPFVPLAGMTVAECVELARGLAQRAADELGIPIYLYEQAATRPDRVNLETIRKGQYEGLKEAIEADPDRAPDFGPSMMPSAGATVIGVRPPLVAYNVYLTTDDVGIAKKIARAVRHSSGGLRYVKGAGFLVEGQAQVSMNLTDTSKTPMALVTELIRREAQRYGVGVSHSEMVGLVPQSALIDAAQWYLQMDMFEPDQVLETRLFEALGPGEGEPAASFLDDLASDGPTPGGGSAAAYSGAMAAGLVAMVARVTLGKKKYAEVETRMQAIIPLAEELRAQQTAAVSQDAAAFDQVMAAYKLPKDNGEDKAARSKAIQEATVGAARVPLGVAERAAETIELALETAQKGNVNAISDAASAAALARASYQGASLNVRINAQGLEDQKEAKQWLKTLDDLGERFEKAKKALEKALTERAEM